MLQEWLQEENGVSILEEELCGCRVTTVQVQTAQAAVRLGKEPGTYITIMTDAPLDGRAKIRGAGECLALVLDRVLRPYHQGRLCICGLGNNICTADALGPEVTCRLPLHFLATAVGLQGNFQTVYSFAPGTLATNNIPTEKIVSGVVHAVEASCVLLVDAIVTRDPERLFQTIQVSTAGGTSPFTAEQKADWSILGLPVISVGVPVAIPVNALWSHGADDGILLTSTMVQDVIAASSTMIAYGIMRACWPTLTHDECFALCKVGRDPMPCYPAYEDGM